ncbi:HTH-type transcriptional regulator Hpr [Alkalihalobacillus pseudalcaliphilus]|uniref:HTH-type transcriptional regulator Hpr n=1 Tax=Alkalihalobacillus pseudalcaliphilus TaxID=79884 RepID=UPI00064DAF77|nr:HTH-type transcriptional regulator Hpr [Alkalihalobacillus pseudalcaliphilus]KMK75685.1 transcriptional regulator [Alkalihalobacillus pseudalcaliphilus]
MEHHQSSTLLQSLLFSHKVAQLSKALWKSVEKDWQKWIKPFDLNINEHHILWLAYQLDGAAISDIAKFGVMHVSTAFNFSKKLEAKGYLTFSKKDTDKRNTYVCLTEEGRDLFVKTMEAYELNTYSIFEGALPIKELYGKFPEFSEIISIVRHLYGSEFVDTFEQSLMKLEHDFIDNDGQLKKPEPHETVAQLLEATK